MEINSPRPDGSGAIRPTYEPFLCPRWARRVDLRPFLRLPTQQPGRPKHDLVDALRGHLFYQASLEAAGSEVVLVRRATQAWDLDPETATKQLRAYARGEVCPSMGKQVRLTALLPNTKWNLSWPWEALYFRRPKTEPDAIDAWRVRKRDSDSCEEFWSALVAYRDALDRGVADNLVQSANQMLSTLDAFIKSPVIKWRRIEAIDLVTRLLCAMPAFLMPQNFRWSFVCEGLLTEAEERAALVVDEDDWSVNSISIRYVAAVAVHGSHGRRSLYVERQAWNFFPWLAKQNGQFDSDPFPGMLSEEDVIFSRKQSGWN